MPVKNVVLGFVMFSLVLAGCEAEEGKHEQMVNLNEVKEDTEGQLKHLNEAIRKSKRDGSLYTRRAVVFLRKGELEEALADANKAVSLTKNDPFSLFIKAQILRALNKPEEALPLALQAERNSFQSSSLYVLLGELYLQQKDYQQARAYLDKAQQMSPYDEFAFYYKGRLAEISKDTSRAIRNYKLALEQAPEFMEPQRELAGLYVAKGDYVTAKPYLMQAREKAEKDGLVWYYTGLLYQGEQKQDSAAYSFAKAVALTDTLQEAHYKLGLLRYNQGDTDASLRHLEKATRYKGKPGYLMTLAGAYERSGQYDKSLQAYQHLVALEPRNTYGNQAVSRLKYKIEKPLPDTTNVVQEEIEQLD
ncbi:tetratricopeptide repeat protein [Pontibacter locisalis]|uniref:Tetratricopeptide repeat protein n=1 Tax=Pontibacter locisalis TaxID=1719035 RepID=A0ABW5IP97_9BACT